MGKPTATDTDKHYQVPWGPVAAGGVTVAIYLLGQLIVPLAIIIITLLFALIGVVVALVTDSSMLSAFIENPISLWQAFKFNFTFGYEAIVARLSSTIGTFLMVFGAMSTMLGLLYLFLRRQKARLEDLGLIKPQLRDIGYTLIGFGAYLVLYILAVNISLMFVPSLDISQQQELGFSTATTGGALILIFISLVILPPLVEEIIMRGFLFGGLRTKLGFWSSAVITSIIFAIAHLQFGSGNPLLWIAAIDTFVLSMVLVGLREKTGSLWSPIGLHALKNGIAFVSLFVLRIV